MDGHTYTYRGLTFGEGADILVTRVDGLGGFEARSGDREIPRGHGSTPGKHFAASRQVMFRLHVNGDPTSVEEMLAELQTAFLVSEDDQHELRFARPGRPERMIRCRPIVLPRVDTPPAFFASPSVALIAADPRIYSVARRQLDVPLFSAGGAIDYPVEYPKDYTSGVYLDAVARNAGNADAYPLVRFYGPSTGTLTRVVLRNLTTGAVLDIDTDILTGQILTFDGEALVTVNGNQVVGLDGASRYGDWQQPREPFALPPGESLLRFEITGTGTTARCLLTWHDTWID